MAVILQDYEHSFSIANRQLFSFDTYEGFAKTDLTGIDSEKDSDFNNTFIGLVKNPWANTTGTVCM